MISYMELKNSLIPYNHIFYKIENINEYYNKIKKFGKCYLYRDISNKLISYLLFYDNFESVYLTMIWTNPDYRRKGYARKLLATIINNYEMDIIADYMAINPVGSITKGLNFKEISNDGGRIKILFQKKIAIMQPYFLPYLGYFNLIHASKKFIFLDDANFINKGWINRNKILLNGDEFLFSIPIQKSSQNRKIFELVPIIDLNFKKKFFARIDHAYKKSPNFYEIKELLRSIFNSEYKTISDLAINSIICVNKYLGKDFCWSKSSLFNNSELEKKERLIDIIKIEGFSNYVNAANGNVLYDKQHFKNKGINLFFLEPKLKPYEQNSGIFRKGLSIIDVLMFNDKDQIYEMLSSYDLK